MKSPHGEGTRPTSDRARQAIFNILQHASWLETSLPEDAYVLDAFAGTGALGLEALSRGAQDAAFMERDPAAAMICRDNIRALGFEKSAHMMTFDATQPPPLPSNVMPRTLIFLDPPYGSGLGVKALNALAARGWLAAGAVCVLEMKNTQPEETPAGFIPHDERKYGIARVRFMTWAG